MAYATGDGVAEDQSEAFIWFERAAKQGDASGEYALGEMYFTGRGVKLDYLEAAKWLQSSAKQGDARAQYNLAAMFSEGKGVVKNDAESAKWLMKSAEQGFAAGEFGLGVIYAHGRGVAKDESEAAKWYRKAMQHGDQSAANNLAMLLVTSSDSNVRNLHEAVQVALQLTESNPQESVFLDTLASVYYANGQPEKAAEAEKKALALNPDNADYTEALQKYVAQKTN